MKVVTAVTVVVKTVTVVVRTATVAVVRTTTAAVRAITAVAIRTPTTVVLRRAPEGAGNSAAVVEREVATDLIETWEEHLAKPKLVIYPDAVKT